MSKNILFPLYNNINCYLYYFFTFEMTDFIKFCSNFIRYHKIFFINFITIKIICQNHFLNELE